MCEAGKKKKRERERSDVRSDKHNIHSSCLYVWAQAEIGLSQYFLPSLHIYIGRLSLVNIGLNQTLKSLITFKQTLHYSAVDTVRERKK
jgi:hypothetical protein